MAIDRVLITIMGLAIVAIALMILGQAMGQFDSVLKTVLRPPKDEPDPEPVRLRDRPCRRGGRDRGLIPFTPVPYGVMRSGGFLGVRHSHYPQPSALEYCQIGNRLAQSRSKDSFDCQIEADQRKDMTAAYIVFISSDSGKVAKSLEKLA